MSPYFSERDVEVPQLLNFVDAHSKEITTALDVGCYGSKYLKELKERGKIVDGIDLLSGESEKEFLQNYFVGNAITYPDLTGYDLVICLSTIEHAGIQKGYRVNDFVEEQNALFRKLLDASKRFIYVTFPYGDSWFIEGESVNISRDRVDQFLQLIPKTAVCKIRFYFNNIVYAFADWTEILQSDADKVHYDPAKGCRCVCILEVIK